MEQQRSSDIKSAIVSPETLSADRLRELNRRYPFFPLPAIALLDSHLSELSDDEIAGLRLHLAVTTADKKALFDILGERAESFRTIYPPESDDRSSTTQNAIETFFANYGSSDPDETALLERMIFNPVPSDYAARYISSTPETTTQSDPESLESRIDAFVRDHSPAPAPESREPESPQRTHAATQPRVEDTPAKTPRRTRADDSLLSESLAKIFIKQGRYERAYEIISNLSLNYPKKSIYFADQLRFLQKLILIKEAASRQ